MTAIAVWLHARTAPAWDVVFQDGQGPVLIGNDPWFHLHQAEGAAEHFPRLIRWDVGTQFPKGSRVAAAGLFDLLAAAAGKVTSLGNPSQERLIVILAWFPILFGLASVICFYGLARDLLGPGLALVALWIRVLFPGSELDRTMLGFGDHHCAEIFLATLGLWLLIRYERAMRREGTFSKVSLYFYSLPFALFLFTWAGGALHIALLLIFFWSAFAVSLSYSSFDAGSVVRFLPYFGSLLALIGVIGLVFPDLVMDPASHRFAVFALGAHLVIMLGLWKLIPGMIARIGRIASVSILAGIAVCVVLVFVKYSPRMDYFLGVFFSQRNTFVTEHQSVGYLAAKEMWGVLLFVAPLGLISVFRRNVSVSERASILFIAGIFLFWQQTGDLRYLVSSLTPILVVGGLKLVRDKMVDFFPRLYAVRWVPSTAVVILALLQIFHFSTVLLPFKSHASIFNFNLATPPWNDAMRWLRTNTPKPTTSPTHLAEPWKNRQGFDYEPGSYGVLTHWHYGNIVSTLGQRLAVTARGRSGKFFEWFRLTNEEESRKKLREYGEIRYVIVDGESACESIPGEVKESGRNIADFQVADGVTNLRKKDRAILSFGDEFRSSIGARLFLGDGLGMGSYRLVYESDQPAFIRYRANLKRKNVHLCSTLLLDQESFDEARPFTVEGASWRELGGYFCYSGQITSAVKIFECVRGAKLICRVGGAEPVTVETKVTSEKGRSFVFRQSAEPDEEGIATLVVPYPTKEVRGYTAFHAESPYTIISGGMSPVEVRVSEADVLDGGEFHLDLMSRNSQPQ